MNSEHLETLALTLIAMTYREVSDFAGCIDSTGDDLLAWAEKYLAPKDAGPTP